MTKNQTVELLQNQLPGFYSVEQVIKMINDIEEDGQAQAYNEGQIEELIEKIVGAVDSKLDRMDSDDLVDLYSAEFDLNGNEISLCSVQVHTCTIKEEVEEILRDKLTDFFLAPQV